MNQLQVFENELFKVSAKTEGEQILFDAEQVAKSLGITTEVNGVSYVRWSRVNSYLPNNLPQVAKGDFISEPLVYKLAFKASNDVAEKFQDWLAIEVIPKIRKTGSYQKPQSIEDLIIMQAQSMKEIRESVKKHNEQLETVNHRLDNIDKIDTLGDLQQRLNGMIRRFAQQEGINFGTAWREFRNAFNTAYRTNLKARINNYKEKHGLKTLTMPQYLSVTNNLEDAVRVADKLLNQRSDAS